VAKKKSSDLGVITQFDYLVLPSEQRAIVQQRTGEIRERLQRSAQDIWEIGQRLADVRSALKHGQFEAWLKAEFGWSRRTAYNFINVYETFQERANLAQIDIATSALYLLAAPSTPSDVREASLREAKEGKKITHKDLRDRMELGRSQADSFSESVVETGTRPEIVALIPQARPELADDSLRHTAIDVPAQVVAETPLNLSITLQPGWYLLDRQHLIFCGDTASPVFYRQISEAAFALAITADDWDHDWLVDAAKSVTILPESELQGSMLEQLIMLFSQPQDIVIFPWLPDETMIETAHRLGRKVIAGDLSLDRCQRAIQATRLVATRVDL
jgi:DNA modification methylase